MGENEEYLRRIAVFDHFVVLEYSKRPMFNKHFYPSKVKGEDIEVSLLFEVTARTVEEAFDKMEEKVKRFKSLFISLKNLQIILIRVNFRSQELKKMGAF